MRKTITPAILLAVASLCSTFPQLNAETGTCRCVFTNRPVPNDARHLTPADRAFSWTLSKPTQYAGFTGATLTFPSPVTSPHPCNNTVWCEYYLPEGRQSPGPAAVVLHFLNDPDFRVTRMVCNYLVRQGIPTLLVKMAYYGERRPTDLQMAMTDNLDLLVSGWVQSVQDIRCAVHWLASRRETDPVNINIVGTSLGALVGSLTLSVEPRISRGVLILGGGNLNHILWNAPETRMLRKSMTQNNITRDATSKLLAPIEPLRFAGPQPKGSILMISAKKDRTVPPDCARALAGAFENSETIWYDTTHTGTAVHLFEILERTGRFILNPPANRRGKQLFFRLLGAKTNAPILPKTHSAWTHDGIAVTGHTGMADEGFTEFPFCFGRMDFTFLENCAIYPRLISDVPADETGVNTADILMDHVYQPDGCVWGLSGKTFVQTFTATNTELVSITLLVASEPGRFKAALLEDGPGGRQIGPARPFSSGHSMTWGWARWKAGQAPLEPGRTYGIKIRRTDGAPFSPYLHATGNAYDGGMLHVDGRPHPESDLAAWIVQEPPDLKRSMVKNSDDDGWVFNTQRVTILPRTPNIRLITATVRPVAGPACDLVLTIFNGKGKCIAGPKQSLATGPAGGERTAPFLFARDELGVSPGEPYHATIFTVPHKTEVPDLDSVKKVSRDMRLFVYGEPEPGTQPVIFNLKHRFQSQSRLALCWTEPFPCPKTIQTWGLGPHGNKTFHVDAGITKAVIPRLWAGHEYRFKLTATGPTGMTWETPDYLVRMPRKDVTPISQTPPYHKAFVTLAPQKNTQPPAYEMLRYRKEVAITNFGFEEGLAGWTASPGNIIGTPDLGWGSQSREKKLGINTKWGDRAAGFTHCAGKQREQVFQESGLSQMIKTTPGHTYILAAMIRTAVKNGPQGDTRVRLFNRDGGQAGIKNASQWYWTDGRWMRFQHEWKAAADTSSIGVDFFRWRDLDQADAYVDEIHVYDLGKLPKTREDPPAFADPRMESDPTVEAFLQAPPGHVITGIGARAHYDNITTLWLKVQPLLPDGTLGEAEQLRGGWEADSHLEARVELPPGHVATGFGAGIAPEWDVKRLRVWGRPLLPGGALGEEKEFRGGQDLQGGCEKVIRLAPGRILISAGLNCMFNDVNKIKGASARLRKKTHDPEK